MILIIILIFFKAKFPLALLHLLFDFFSFYLMFFFVMPDDKLNIWILIWQNK